MGARTPAQDAPSPAGAAQAARLGRGLVFASSLVLFTGVVCLWAPGSDAPRLTATVVPLSAGVVELVAAPATDAPRARAGARTLRPLTDYASAGWCDECHVREFREWRCSSHARTIPANLRHNAEEFHAGLERDGLASAASVEPGGSVCSTCHAPLNFHSDTTRALDAMPALAAEGVTCAVCHTAVGVERLHTPTHVDPAFMRQLTDKALARGALGKGGSTDLERLHADMRRFYVGTTISAPERVRRYVGQGSDNAALRRLGNLLIRLRPERHRVDYSPDFLRSAEACAVCHNRSYPSWHGSAFRPRARPSPEGARCQDCHMRRLDDLSWATGDYRPALDAGRPTCSSAATPAWPSATATPTWLGVPGRSGAGR